MQTLNHPASAIHNLNHLITMNPDPFNTRARTGHPVSTRNRRRRALPTTLAVILSLAALGLAIMAIIENAK